MKYIHNQDETINLDEAKKSKKGREGMLPGQKGMKSLARTPLSVSGGPAINPFGLSDRWPLIPSLPRVSSKGE